MENLQSMLWKVISKGAHPQQDQGCKVVLLRVTASLVGKQRKRPETTKTFVIFFSYFERKTFVLERDQTDVASTMQKKTCITQKSLMISSFKVALEHYYILLT